MMVRTTRPAPAVWVVLALALISVRTTEGAQALLPRQESDLSNLYLSVVEDAVDVFEPIWTEETGGVPNAGFFDFRRYGNWRDEPYATIIVVPGNGMVVLAYATLLTQTDRETFGRSNVPRDRLLDHAIKSIRWCCLTSTYVENPFPYLPGTRDDFADGRHWRRRLGWRADEVGYLTLGAALLWDRLDDETRGAFQDVATGTAARERLVRRWRFGQAGNHDQVKQDLSSTIGAAYLCPDDPDAAKFRAAICGNAIDMVATRHDFARRDTRAEGRPISEWAEAWNLYEDYSSDHHGHANIWYGIDMLFEGRAYVEILSRLTGKPVPETFSYPGNGFDGVLEWAKVLCLPNGGLAHPHGAEYDSYYGAGLLAFCYGALLRDDPVAAAFEQRAANLLARHSRAVRQYDYHRGSWAKAAMAYLLHRLPQKGTPEEGAKVRDVHTGPRQGPALFQFDGSRHYRDQQCLIARLPRCWTSFSWGTKSQRMAERGLCGVVAPMGRYGIAREPLVYFHPYSLTGRIDARPASPPEKKPAWRMPVYRWEGDDAGFSTAGYLDEGPVRRYQAFFSFGDATCVVFTVHRALEDCAYSWAGLPIYFYHRDGLTDDRRVYHAGGDATIASLAETRSHWWSAHDDDLGLIIARGPATIRGERVTGYNWARKDSYKDKCDIVYAATGKERNVAAKAIAADVGAVVVPNSNRRMIERTATRASDLTGDLPADWRGVVTGAALRFFPERRLAIVNFDGPSSAVFQLQFDVGAPVFDTPTEISGKTARTTIQLEPLETWRQSLDVYIEAPPGRRLRARRTAFDRLEVRSPDGTSVSISLRFFRYDVEEIVRRGPAGELVRRWPVPPWKPPDGSPAALDPGIELTVGQPMTLELRGQRMVEGRPPTVEIEEIKTRPDGTVDVRVGAADRSGIAEVILECDGDTIGERTEPPYRWECRPGRGWHTFQAFATDRSTDGTARTGASFPRTVKVD